jgi:DUF1680 family protein
MSRNIYPLVLTIIVFNACTRTGERQDYPIQAIPFTQVKMTDSFWKSRIDTNRLVTIPYAFEQSEITGRIDNFALAGELIHGEQKGDYPFDDTDVYKIIEGASYSLAVEYNAERDSVKITNYPT